MPTIVELPDNTELEFPDGMDQISMRREIVKAFPQFASPTESESPAIPAPGESTVPRKAGPTELTVQTPGAFPAQAQQLTEMQAARTPELTAQEAEQMVMTPQITIPNVIPKSWPITRGTFEVAKGIPEFMTAPAAPLITVAQQIPFVREAVDAAMGAGMVKSAAQLAGESSVTGDREKMAQAVTSGILGAGMFAGPHVAPMLANEIAARRVGAPDLTGEDMAARRQLSIRDLPLEVQESARVTPQSPTGGLFAPRDLTGAAVMPAARPRGPKPVIPETPPEPERGLTVIQEIRAKGLDTKEKIRGLFPQLSRETAAQLRDQAFPKEKIPDNLSQAEVDRLFLDKLNEESNQEIEDASRQQQAAEVHGDVPPQSVEGARQMPAEESGRGVQPQTERGLQETQAQAQPAVQDLGKKPISDWLKERLKERETQGWNPKWPFVPADLMNKGFRELILKDPTLSLDEKRQIMKFGGPQAKDELAAYEAGRLPTEPAPVATAAAKVESEVKAVARSEGKRSAKEIKDDLVDKIQRAIDTATGEGKVTIEIPGDGTFTVFNAKEPLEGLLKRAKKIEIRDEPKISISKKAIESSAEALAKQRLYGPPETPPATEPPGAPISPGPGAAAVGEPGTYSAIEQLSDRLRTVPSTAKASSLSFRQRLADKITTGRNAFAKAVGRVRAVSETLKQARAGMRDINDVDRAVGELDRDLQTSAGDSRNLGKVMERTYKDANMRRAAALYIDAGGDVQQFRAALSHLPENTRPEVRRAIETVANMSDEGRNLADFLREYYGIREQDAKSADIFKQGLEDYFTHIWQREENMPDKLRAAVSSGKVNTYWQFARHRKISTFLEGILEGKTPELDPAKVIPHYNFTLDRAIASRNFIENASNLKADDGRPVLAATGTRQEISATEYAVGKPGQRARRVFDTAEEAQAAMQPGESVEPRQKDMVLIRPQGKNAALTGYRSVDHPAMRKWKWAETSPEGKTVLYEGELQVHPDHYERLARIMERARLTPSTVTRAALRVGGEIKAAKFGFASTFHQLHVGLHAAFHWTNPFRVSARPWVDSDGSINFKHPFVQDALEYGHLKLAGDPHEIASMAEGILAHGALIHKVPFIGPWSRAYSEWLFQDYIPKLKLATYENALPRNLKYYEGKFTPEEIKARVGDAVNNAYGELNRLFLGKYGRDPRFQRSLQLAFLAPDFGEARLRFMSKALTKGGHEERLALATMFTTLYLTARVGNYLSHGNPEWDWKKAFSVKQGDHWYSVRSVLGDVDHALSDFVQFATVRLSPAARTLLEGLTRRDSRGQKRLPSEQVADFARQFVPITVQGLAEPDRAAWDSFRSAMGLQTRRENSEQEVKQMIRDWMKRSKDPKVQAKIARAEKETFAPSDYAPLRSKLRDRDQEGAQAEYRKLRKTKTAQTINEALRPTRPLSGSLRTELEFRRSLTPGQRAIYNRALHDRQQQYQRFLMLSR